MGDLQYDIKEIHKEVEKMGKSCMKGEIRCVVCGGRASVVGTFVPNSPEVSKAFGSPPGKIRVMVYPVCDIHVGDTDAIELALMLDCHGGGR